MNEKLIIVGLIILASISLVLRAYPLGYDSYYFLHHLRENTTPSDNNPPLFFVLFHNLPFNETFYRVLPILFFGCFVLLGGLIGKNMGASGFLTSVLMFAAPVFAFRSFILEDDLIGLLLG